MVMEQHNSEQWKQQLLAMGYDENDVSRAYEAGVTNAAHAIDWLESNPEQEHQNTRQKWPFIPESVRIPDQPGPDGPLSSSNVTQSRKEQHEDVKETGRSIDNLVLARHSSATPAVTGEGLQTKQDEELQRVMEISRKEHDQREMERALLKSKQEGAARQSGDQDPELIRAIEESLKDNPDLVKDHNASWHSQAFVNPIERVRKDIDEPIGLRNIGNTCYLNSLLQVYYYLPDFRRAIMSFRAPECYRSGLFVQACESSVQTRDDVAAPAQGQCETRLSASLPDEAGQEGGASDNSDNRIIKLAEESVQRNAVEFVVELQRLFSTMALGNQNCADPTAVTRAMRDNHGKPISIGAQRDASEFNQLFLDTIEKGLSAGCSNLITEHGCEEKASSAQNGARHPMGARENIVKNMFTMKFRQEIWRCSEKDNRNAAVMREPITTNWETTSIIVDATTRHERNLHGGLEDLVLTQIKYLDGSRDPEKKPDSSSISNEEQTTRKNPTGVEDGSDGATYAALKTVWFTRLPPVVVVYLQRGSYNRETLRAEKVHDRYEFPTKLAFDRYLEVNREAAETARKEIQAIRRERDHILNLLDQYKRFPLSDVGIPRDIRTSRSGYVHKDNGRLSQNGSETEREDFFEAGARIQKRLREAMQPGSTFHTVSTLTPERIESSLDTIEKILDHDRKRCNELEARLQSIKSESEVYRGLDDVMYDLHAVLVHDGAPDSGHYWTFISNRRFRNESEKWVKLSDSNVSLVSEKEMLSWSLGGNGKASAYCLMYTTADNTRGEQSISEESMNLLPQQILDEISEASEAFEKEVEAAARTKT